MARRAPLGVSIAIALALAAPSSAAAATNTFSVNCRDIPILAQWDPPITGVPHAAVLTGTLDGGSCSGTVNGEPFEDKPFAGRAVLPGIHSCELGEGHGRGAATIDGRKIYVDVTYRRTGRDGVLLFKGDAGGQAVMRIHGRVGLIPPTSPLASVPLLQPLVEPTDFASFAAACGSPQGVNAFQVIADSLTTVPTLSSTAVEGGPTASGGQTPHPTPARKTRKRRRPCAARHHAARHSRARARARHRSCHHEHRSRRAQVPVAG